MDRDDWALTRLSVHLRAQDEQGRICEIPLSWTNLAAEDPFVILSAGKSSFRFEDLLELTRLIQEVRRNV